MVVLVTWGGSTVDNLGSITEDEDVIDQDGVQDDDGYPSDGIVQVEEEEEENDSDGTYTIEDDARQRRRAQRSRRTRGDQGDRPKLTRAAMAASNAAQGCPRPMGKRIDSAQSKSVSQKKGKRGKRDARLKQENYRSAEQIVHEEEEGERNMSVLQKQLERTSQMCQAVLDHQPMSPSQSILSPSGFGMRAPGMMPDVQQQLQQQQLMMCLNQCYQQLSMQQVEMQNIQQQLHVLTVQVAENSHQATPVNNDAEDQWTNGPAAEAPRMTTPITSSFSTIPNGTASYNMHSNSRQAPFNLNPQFPPSFSMPSRDDGGKKRSMSLESQNNAAHVNNLRPVPPPRVDSYLSQAQYNGGGAPASDARSTRLNLQDALNTRKSKHKRRGQTQPATVGRYSTPGGAEHELAYRPGLSSGISGAGFHEGTSLSSIMSTQASDAGRSRNVGDGDTACDLSLFEALRETIYSEVATLISQNESRPHFLIELFRVLQVLNSDYLRQRGLYAIKDLLSKTLQDENSYAAAPPPWLNVAVGNCTPSELTPSESLVTSDEEEVKARLRERVDMVRKSKHMSLLEMNGSLTNNSFDYVEKVDNTSTLSTPSNSLWDSPFAQDSLGNTVIHFDKALEKMREYERLKAESERQFEEQMQGRPSANLTATLDQGSESSVSDMPYPRIDTNQLDMQIKSIMSEIIPVIKEHLEDACSPQLLDYIKRLILSLTRQHDNGQEFARFFHRQLGSILQDSMTKFEGRKMRECGEEILVDMSEVLFNELAFFRLMQDLDEPTADKLRSNTWFQSVSDRPSPNSRQVAMLVGEDSNGSGNSSDAVSNEDRVPSTRQINAADKEYESIAIQDSEEKDDVPESPFKSPVSGGLQIELAVSETKPFTRIGSDEDDDEADESRSMEDLSETAVSRNSKLEHAAPSGDFTIVEQTEALDGTVTDGSLHETDGNTFRSLQTGVMNGDLLINGENIGEVITIDDLPASLSICRPANVDEKFDEEQKMTYGAPGIIVAMETPSELAGDGNTLKDPVSDSCV